LKQSGGKLYQNSRISGLFFAGKEKGRLLFLLLEDGVLLQMEISTSQLYLLVAQENGITKEEFTHTKEALLRCFQCKQLIQMENWHAGGITACTYDPRNQLLVIASGLKNPSEILKKKNASALSVWKIQIENKKQEPLQCELLDYTMILTKEFNHKTTTTKKKIEEKEEKKEKEKDQEEDQHKEEDMGQQQIFVSWTNFFLFGIFGRLLSSSNKKKQRLYKRFHSKAINFSSWYVCCND
jgi:hypothetical protein